MIKKRIQIFLCVFFFSFLFSKSIEIKNNENPVKDAEAILLQEKNFDQDSVSLKKFLAPLLLSKNPNHQILYYGLLANGYFNFYKKDNPESVDNYQKSINLAEKKQDNSYLVWAQLNYSSYRYHYYQYSQMLPVFVAAVRKIENLKDHQIILPQQSYKQIAWVMQTIGATDDEITYFVKKQ